MANRVRSTALIGGVAVFAVLLLMGQCGQAQTVASDRPAGYVVFPKVVVDSSAVGSPDNIRTDTLIQLTNTGSNCQTVECFYVNATKHCNGGGGLNANGACRVNADCAPGVTCGIQVPTGDRPADCGQERNITFVLSANQAIAWSADRGGFVPPDGNCSGIAQPIRSAGEAFFQGEVKCIEVSGTPGNPGGPIAANDLKGEATIYEVQPGTPGGVDVRAYNAVGIEAVSSTGDAFQVCSDGSGKACTSNTQCTSPATCVPSSTLCLGSNGGTCAGGVCTGGTRAGGTCTTNADCGACTSATHASCPSTLVLNNFFDGVFAPNGSGFIDTDLTLVPCSENLASPSGPSGIKPTVAQFVVYNEFEQRFSASVSVGCFRETLLSNIDTLPGNETASIFNVAVQGTIAGQTRIHGVAGTDAAVGHGLLGVAEEFINAGTGFPRGSDAFNLNYVGTTANKADLVFIP